MNVKFFLFALILLLVMIGSVSASNNTVADINITFDEQMWDENLTDIHVDVNENITGNFAIKINDEVIYNDTITNKSFNVPIKLPKNDYELYINIYPPLDSTNYKVNAFLNGINLNLNKTLKIMKYPRDFNYFYFPEEIHKNYD